jgi:ketosteroid isomerase-like protein
MSVLPDAALASEIVEVERTLYRAMIAKDIATLERLLAADLVYVHSPGFSESRAEYLRAVQSKVYDYKAIESRDVRIQAQGDLAVEDGLVDMSVATGGGAVEHIHLFFVLVWVRQQGSWRLALRHATRMPK